MTRSNFVVLKLDPEDGAFLLLSSGFKRTADALRAIRQCGEDGGLYQVAAFRGGVVKLKVEVTRRATFEDAHNEAVRIRNEAKNRKEEAKKADGPA